MLSSVFLGEVGRLVRRRDWGFLPAVFPSVLNSKQLGQSLTGNWNTLGPVSTPQNYYCPPTSEIWQKGEYMQDGV